jgi:hypothetical protein
MTGAICTAADFFLLSRDDDDDDDHMTNIEYRDRIIWKGRHGLGGYRAKERQDSQH